MHPDRCGAPQASAGRDGDVVNGDPVEACVLFIDGHEVAADTADTLGRMDGGRLRSR